ncbi:MAG: efflux RND transporter periplasmic adaptor subunit [Candidatus Competibacteraceae bacterium]|nr:efflux RND transporter periplasmic adaptor subunit [Candidatus Competibacteraceae bacterium]
MAATKPPRPRPWLLLVPLLIGVAVLALLISTREAPRQAAPGETPRPVRVIPAPRLDVEPRAVGFGTVEPATVWEAVAQVAGQVVALHPRLANGEIIPQGETLVTLDPSDYRLAVAQAEANLRAMEARLAELEVRQANTRASLAIERQALELAERELERKRRLVERGTVTRSDFDQERRGVLGQRQGVQAQENALELIPAQRRLLLAQQAVEETRLEATRLDLARTVIEAPFTGRVARVEAEVGEFIRQGEVLLTLDGIQVAEVAVQLPVAQMRELIRPAAGQAGPGFPVTEAELTRLRELVDIRAQVRLRAQDFVVEWPARFARIAATIDPKTRTVGVIVAVDKPYAQARPGERPPLIKGMFVEVELAGRPYPAAVTVPRSALLAGSVWVADDDNRLQRRAVEVGLVQPDYATIEAGLKPGERVVVSDPVPAIEGMLLAPVVDGEALAALEAAVR